MGIWVGENSMMGGIVTVADVLFHFPASFIKRTNNVVVVTDASSKKSNSNISSSSSSLDTIYTLTQDLKNTRMQSIVTSCLNYIHEVGNMNMNRDWLDEEIRIQKGWDGQHFFKL